MPVVFAALGAWVIWRFVRQQRGATVMLLLVLALDLAVWGQSSGWRVVSPEMKSDLWGRPDPAKFIDERIAKNDGGPFRVLTADQPFDPDTPVPEQTANKGWVATLQPDLYMMYGIENAAGYDGFGLARYNRLAGDMKVWGDRNPERTLRLESRTRCINVRYLMTRPLPSGRINSRLATLSPSVPGFSSCDQLRGRTIRRGGSAPPSAGSALACCLPAAGWD